jgi:hypothetical protein
MSCCGGLKPLVSGTPPEDTLLTIMGDNTRLWYRGDVLVLNGATVLSWTDQSGNGFDGTSAAATNEPTFNATGGPNATPSVLFDGVDNYVANAVLNLPAPGTTPTFYWAVLRQVTWTANERLWGAGADSVTLTVFQPMPSGTPFISMINAAFPGGNPNGALAVNTYKRLEVSFSNTAADYIKAGSTTITGGNTGNNDAAAGFVLGAAANLTTFGNIEVADFAIFDVLPSVLQKAQLDAYAGLRYGAAVLV